MSETVKVKKLKENAVIPKRATDGSAGADLYACIDEPVVIEPSQLVKIPTGIAIELQRKDLGVFLFARSGLGVKYGITLSNGVGVVDSDYRGEICVGLCNVSDKPYTIQPIERIAQMVIMPVVLADFIEADELGDTQRGTGGFGSSGKM
jgi:dUTP pyrophosphatase